MSKKPRNRQRHHTRLVRQEVKHYVAKTRSPLGDWWFEHRKQIRTLSIIVGGALFIVYMAYEFFRIVL